MWQPSWACPTEGYFYPPTLFTGVAPAATIAQEEIFGPVLVTTTFRTPAEAVALANNTRYGLAASVWTENVNLALDIAPQLKAGVVWVNSTNLFDAATGFGGYRESGFGREGGHEGMFEYLRPRFEKSLRPYQQSDRIETTRGTAPGSPAGIDRTAKMYIGGKQARPDSGYSRAVLDKKGARIAEVGGRQPQGYPQRRRGGAQGGSLEQGHHAQPRAGALLRRGKPAGPCRGVS